MESVVVRFTPLSGGHSEEPPCYLLEMGGVKILLDCGWCEPYDINMLKPLARVAKDIDFVLLTHPDLLHLGALPYAISVLGLSCPIYCTTPTHTMGLFFMYDAYMAKHYNLEDFNLFTPAMIDNCFAMMKPLKFSQHQMLDHKKGTFGIEITPYCAGHMIGGCFWRFKCGMDEIIYVSDYNHVKERHLEPGILQTLQRPMLLIVGDCTNTFVEHKERRADRDKQLLESIIGTMRAGGNVLIPVDTAGRSLELSYMLDQYWKVQRIAAYSLVLLSTQCANTNAAAGKQLEWMHESVAKKMQGDSMFEFLGNVHMCRSTDELAPVPAPMVVLATMDDLESGFSRETFAHWAADSRNLILAVDRSLPGTLKRRLIQDRPREVALHLSKRVILQGEELAQFRRTREIRRLQEMELERARIAKQELLEAQQVDEGAEEDLLANADALFAPTVENPFFVRGQFDLLVAGDPAFLQAPPVFPPSRAAALAGGVASSTGDVGEWSAYGTIVDPKAFQVDQQIFLNAAGGGGGAADQSLGAPDGKNALLMAVEDVPTKLESVSINIPLNASVRYIDFEGKSDGKSLKTIIQQVQPRSVIFVRGSVAAVEEMKRFATQELGVDRVHAPDVDQTVDATSSTQIFGFATSEALKGSLRWAVVDDHEVAFLQGRVHDIVSTTEGHEYRVLTSARTAGAADDDGLDYLSAATSTTASTAGANDVPPDANQIMQEEEEEAMSHRSLFIGRPALKDIKSALDKQGFRSEFQQGVLIVNDVVTVRKEGQDAKGTPILRVDGGFSADFFAVREIVFSKFQVL